MNTKPMIFTAENIRGIRDGRKTMTRRVIKPQPSEGGLEWCTAADGAFGAWQDPLLLLDEHSEDGGPCQRVCPYGVPGDLLFVKEGFRLDASYDPCGPAEVDSAASVFYRDDGASRENPNWDGSPISWGRSRSSIHMPRKFSRLTLRVSNMRVERVQDISAWDAMHEGLPPGTDILSRFAALWDSINGKRAPWVDNPLVWVISWDKRWNKNVDAVIKELGA